MTSRNQIRWLVRIVSALCAVLFMYTYSRAVNQPHNLLESSSSSPDVAGGSRPHHLQGGLENEKEDSWVPSNGVNRHLLSFSNGSHGNSGDNCSAPRAPHPGYNNSCDFVLQECGGDVQLINYLAFVLCDLQHVQPLGYILLVIWLLYLISLLATTADYFFVPPLNLLSNKLKLSPSIAGITLLAIGNGAPDVFTAYAALKQGELELVLGALIGASIFISTIVLGTIILITQVTSDKIDKIDFIRDVLAYMCVVALVIGVAYDGDVHLYEAIAFPIFYILYIVIVVVISYLRHWIRKWHQRRLSRKLLTNQDDNDADERAPLLSKAEEKNEEDEKNGKDKDRLVLQGLTWPKGSNILVKFQWLVEWPFSLLRWISVPPCHYDNKWTQWHHYFAVSSPVPMAMVMLVATQGWGGFQDLYLGELPLFAFLIIIGVVISVALFFLVSRDRPPHWSLQIVLGVAAFVMSIAWLNIEANEVVSLLQAFGLLFSIDTAILGLTVLAIGNSVGDLVADTAVARAGYPGMGVASCFGSPLLNDVMGLSVALIAKIGIYDGGRSFVVDIHSGNFDQVKLSWIFLGISLVASAVVFPLFRFSPPKAYGVALLYFYVVFMVFSVLTEVKVLPIHFH